MLLNWFTVVAEIVNFLVLVFLLNRFLFPVIISAMDKREDQIKSRFQQAKEELTQAKEAESKYLDLKKQLEAKREEIEKEYRQEADKVRQDLIGQTRRQVDDLKSKWLEDLKLQQDQLMGEIRQRISSEVMDTVRRVLGDLADNDIEDSIIKKFIERLGEIDPKDLANLKKIPPVKMGEVIIKTGFPLRDPSMTAIDQKITNLLGSVKIKYETSPDLIGGVEATIGGVRISWAIQDFLGDLRERVLTTVREVA